MHALGTTAQHSTARDRDWSTEVLESSVPGPLERSSNSAMTAALFTRPCVVAKPSIQVTVRVSRCISFVTFDSLSPVGSGRKRVRPNLQRECRARCKSRQNVLSSVKSIVMLVMQPRVMSTSLLHASVFLPLLLSLLASQGCSRPLVGGRWQNMHGSTLQHSQTEHSLGSRAC